MRLGFGEIAIILVVALLIFGPTKLPQLGEALGKGIRNFKKATEAPDEPTPQRESPPAELPANPPSSQSQAARAASPVDRKQS
ncbi:MAG TPA: twin-arginine translocase TatA/TatE family subunit [Anaeromyxobacteraceae bacterium]|nr:twin-arginine translocase TatA/TatE family subunit [Anaeromyxobacteraceae bacterium]